MTIRKSSLQKSSDYLSGTSAERPVAPVEGTEFFNTTTGGLQVYLSGQWVTRQKPVDIVAPTSIVATDVGTSRAFNNGKASVSFTPSELGGLVTNYEVTSSPGGYNANGTASPIEVTGLQSNTSYTYTVAASNSYSSATSSASAGVTATTVPQAPTIGTATGADQSATLTFTAGANGGSSITNYKYSTDNSTYTAFDPAQTSSPLTISGLTNDQSYSFYLKSVNANGDSAASAASNSALIGVFGDFESIATATITSNTTSPVVFSNIPQTYEHLQIRIYGRFGSNGHLRLNSDTGSNYNYHFLYGNGTTAGSGDSGGSQNRMLAWGSGNNDGTYPQAIICDLLDYKNTNKNTTARFLWGWDTNNGGAVWLGSGLWRNTNAVSTITIDANEATIYAGAHFALYGIKGVS